MDLSALLGTNQNQPYNDQTAASQIALQRQLAAQLMQQPMPASNMVVPGGPNGFVVNTTGANKWGALSRIMGGVAEGMATKHEQENTIKQRADQQKLLGKLLNGVPDESTLADASTSPTPPPPPSIAAPQNSNAPMPTQQIGSIPGAPQGPAPNGQGPMALPPQQPEAPAPSAAMPPGNAPIVPKMRQLTPEERMSTIGDLANTGKFGEAVASSMMTHKYQYLKNDKTGRIDAVSDTNPNDHVVVSQGTGFDPDSLKVLQPYIEKTDFNNPESMGRLNTIATQMGMQPFTPGMVRGMQSTPTEAAGIVKTNAEVPKINADTRVANATVPKIGAETAVANATVPKINAETGRTQVGTVADQAGIVSKSAEAKAKADGETAEYQNLITQQQRIQSLASRIGGKYGHGQGAISAFLGNNNESATDKQLLQAFMSNGRLQAIAQDEAGSGKGPGASLYKGYGEHGLNESSTPDAIRQMASLMEGTLTKRAYAAQAVSRAHGSILDMAGYKDNTPPPNGSTDAYAGH